MKKLSWLRCVLGGVMGVLPFAMEADAALGNSWHLPANAEPVGTTMRAPVNPVDSDQVFLYNGTFSLDSDQSGGDIIYRKAGAATWTTNALSFDTQNGNNKYWNSSIPASTYTPGDTIEYYFYITYTDDDDTWLGTTNNTASITYATQGVAQTNPFTFTYAFDLGNCWHFPTNTEPPGVNMRSPIIPPQTNQSVFIYNGNQFQGAGNPGDQSGGWLFYREVGAGSWQSNALVFNAESGAVENNKYWRGEIPPASFGANTDVEYYLAIEYTDHNTTYIGSTDGTDNVTSGLESVVQTQTFSFTYSDVLGQSAAFMFHDGNRVELGDSAQFWVKIGYAQGIGTNRYVDFAHVYYTTDGSDPHGAYGTGSGSTMVKDLAFSHMEQDGFEGGDAMWWQGTVTNLPTLTSIRYKIGSYKDTNSLERYADYVAGTDSNLFSFTMGVSTGEMSLTVDGIEADYTTTKFFIDEIANDTQMVEVIFWPRDDDLDATSVEVFSNIDRRDFADVDYTNALLAADGIPDGIKPPNGDLLTPADTGSYFRAYSMTSRGDGSFIWTGKVSRTGAYRLTARYQTNGAPATSYEYYNGRDHAIVASPTKTLDMVLYELNTLTTEATENSEAGRSTFRDLLGVGDPGGDDDAFDPFNLDYLNFLQVNCLWFQPIHPSGIDRSENDPLTGTRYQPGSPYATRDYWAVEPAMSAANTEEAAMTEFTNFVAQCDAYTGSVGSIHIMLDGVFNHTSWDAEWGQGGVDLGFTSNPTNRIGSNRASFYARISDYGLEATFYNSAFDNDFATAPDRGDFGKWADVTELYFGKYAALVRHNPGNNSQYLDEGDWYDYTDMNANQVDIWKYFAYYSEFWLEKTGHPGSNTWVLAQDDLGIDALRCDFGQGLPPQAWEYFINKTRSIKWNFVFMAETLDGGKPGYRSNRHFDILNESLVFNFTQAKINDSQQLVTALEDRRNAYRSGAILLNQTSHDEVMPDNDFWITASRYAAQSAIDGLPMIMYGQEKGLGLHNPSNPNDPIDGFADHELNFGKYVPHFKRWNQLQVWTNPPAFNDGLDQFYGRVNFARHLSPALRSQNRWFLNLVGGGTDSRIFAVAKYETAGAGPASNDVVLAFARFLEHGVSPRTSAANTYDLKGPGDLLWNTLGLDTGKTYGVRNIASSDAFGLITSGWPKTGQDLYDNGIFVSLNAGVGGSITNDGEVVQFLQLVEQGAANQAPTLNFAPPFIAPVGELYSRVVTGDDLDGDTVLVSNPSGPAGSSLVTSNFTWTPGSAFENTTNDVEFVLDDQQGEANSVVTSIVQLVTPFDHDGDFMGDGYEFDNFGSIGARDGTGDFDMDGQNDLNEFLTGTQPTNDASLFQVDEIVDSSGQTNFSITVRTEPGVAYEIQYTDDDLSASPVWTNFANTANGIGTWIETNTSSTTYIFIDDFGPDTTGGAPGDGHRKYRVSVP